MKGGPETDQLFLSNEVSFLEAFPNQSPVAEACFIQAVTQRISFSMLQKAWVALLRRHVPLRTLYFRKGNQYFRRTLDGNELLDHAKNTLEYIFLGVSIHLLLIVSLFRFENLILS